MFAAIFEKPSFAVPMAVMFAAGIIGGVLAIALLVA